MQDVAQQAVGFWGVIGVILLIIAATGVTVFITDMRKHQRTVQQEVEAVRTDPNVQRVQASAQVALADIKADITAIRAVLNPTPFPNVGDMLCDMWDAGRKYEASRCTQAVTIDGRSIQTGSSPTIVLQSVDGGLKRTA